MPPKQYEYPPVMKPIKFLSKTCNNFCHCKRDLLFVRDIGAFGKQFLRCLFSFVFKALLRQFTRLKDLSVLLR